MDLNDEQFERVAERVHNGWWREKLRQGYHAPDDCPSAPMCSACHGDMKPYLELLEHVKDYDRATVRAVLDALRAEGLSVEAGGGR